MATVSVLVGIINWLVMPETWMAHPAQKTAGKVDTMMAGEMEPMIYSFIAVPWWAIMCLVAGTAVVYGFVPEMPTFPEKAIWIPAVGFSLIHFLSSIADYSAELVTGGTEYMSAPIAYGFLGVVILISVIARYVEFSGQKPVSEEGV
jgi:hypothetical protein